MRQNKEIERNAVHPDRIPLWTAEPHPACGMHQPARTERRGDSCNLNDRVKTFSTNPSHATLTGHL
jgi:hypothetical protein